MNVYNHGKKGPSESLLDTFRHVKFHTFDFALRL